MNYEKIYNGIIKKFRNEKSEGYSEIHHIIPRCIGGSNEKENLIKLPGRYHFVAHLCLAKMYGGKLFIAAHRMSERLKYNSREYLWLKIRHAEFIKNLNTGKKQTVQQKIKQIEAQSGEKNAFYGKKHTVESKEKISKNHKGTLGLKYSKETKIKMSKSHKGKIFTSEHCRNLSDSRKNKKIPSPMKNKKHSKESIDKMIKSHLGKIPWNKGIKQKDYKCQFQE